MSESWGHKIYLMRVSAEKRIGARLTTCSIARCEEQPLYVVQWDYVTGRAGRVNFAQRGYCRAHAEKFAKKHGLELPNEVEDIPNAGRWKGESG